ncbi:MAG: sigma-70 family RNA polymerase sigma factor, partial [Thermoanaerobaculia bacterium]
MSATDHDSGDGPDQPAASQLERLRRGDADAWEEVIRVHGARLLAVARRIVRDDQLAQDCLQNALVQAFLKIGTFEERAALTSWLHRIVVNSALMALRSRKLRGEESLDDLLPAFDEYGQRRSESGLDAPTPEELLERADAREVVERAIDALPDGHRMVLLLRDFEELSIQEVAELMQLTPNAVKIRLHRARAALKTLLERPLRRAGAPARSRLRARITGIAGRYLPLMITCREFDGFIMDYLEGSLTGRERLLFEIHVRTCGECRKYLKRYQQTLSLGR